MSEWQLLKLGELITLNYGKALKAEHRKPGNVPVYSSAGLTGTHDTFQVNSEGIIVGRKGTVGKVYYSAEPFCCIDTAYYITPQPEKYNFQFLYYMLQTLGLEELNEDSAVPGLNRETAYNQQVALPPLPEQKAIASVLSSLDDKIDLLHRQNKTLEAMAETLFRQWFIEEAKEDWVQGKVEDIFVLQRGYDLPSSKRIKGDYPLYAASGLNDNINAYQVEYPTVITGRSGSIGGVYISLEKSWPLNTTLFIKEFKLGTLIFSYFYLKYLDLESFNSGSAVPSLNRNHVHGLEIQLPPEKLVNEYEEIAQDWMLKVKANKHQIQTLEQLRDTLLPKLMSGEVRVQYQTEEVA
ncbi:restriction endonuclease subunit S [Acinetobacter sp. YH12211]|uniref:restriction endonuclease subunit S n=1 Tax=Acinetobacter sp. YH12211 TaxID=2601147 RepID=UPI0015D3F369|nr:restriction endonuclease subunit S [Acinetobacter sp. YH12211]